MAQVKKLRKVLNPSFQMFRAREIGSSLSCKSILEVVQNDGKMRLGKQWQILKRTGRVFLLLMKNISGHERYYLRQVLIHKDAIPKKQSVSENTLKKNDL